MQIPGHIAIAILQHRLIARYKPGQTVMSPLLLASLFPDMIDKSIGYIFHAMPNGRHYTHNVFSLILWPGLVSLIWGKKAGYSWFIGFLGHLLVDIGGRGFVPWFFPVKKYHFRQGRLTFKRSQLIREAIFLGLVLMLDRLLHQ